jgi:DNA-binding CsgD family transcriptional regulator
MIHAWRGVGKSHVALGIAYAVATGTDFLRWTAPHPSKVVYIDGEMQAPALKERLQKMHAARFGETEDQIPNFFIITPDLQPEAMLDLADVTWQELLEDITKDAKLVIVDNLSCLARSGGKENEADSWEPIQRWALRMRKSGCAVLFIHHSGKNGYQRGTSRREDILDTVIKLSLPNGYRSEDGAFFEVDFEKGRELFGDAARSFKAKLQEASGVQNWITEPSDATTQAKIVERWKQGLKGNEIADELGISKSTVSRHLKTAKTLVKKRSHQED